VTSKLFLWASAYRKALEVRAQSYDTPGMFHPGPTEGGENNEESEDDEMIADEDDSGIGGAGDMVGDGGSWGDSLGPLYGI